MKPNSQLERLRKLMSSSKLVSGKIVEIASNRSAHYHGKEKVFIMFKPGITEITCDCGVVFKQKET